MSFTSQDAQAIFDQGFAPWVRALALTITDISPTSATLHMPITSELTRMGDVLSGQALAALADTAMVFACAGLFGKMRPVATTNLELQFLRPGLGEAIICTAQIVKPGRSLIFTRASLCAAPSGKEVATATATFHLPAAAAPALAARDTAQRTTP
ncbi:PaaI family thioesterase [uncultured Lentibacter sp.]|jgi:uncharacterized protein (TIGR00369 family)|uniref:PaaI family thioesterase n=1 Tax=uncultured Lentibacter sp. TaxID=1659309 RepID=UPI002606D532|nr:PaaI family thioesterase [uncultured Lentibacter sp.]